MVLQDRVRCAGVCFHAMKSKLLTSDCCKVPKLVDSFMNWNGFKTVCPLQEHHLSSISACFLQRERKSSNYMQQVENHTYKL